MAYCGCLVLHWDTGNGTQRHHTTPHAFFKRMSSWVPHSEAKRPKGQRELVELVCTQKQRDYQAWHRPAHLTSPANCRGPFQFFHFLNFISDFLLISFRNSLSTRATVGFFRSRKKLAEWWECWIESHKLRLLYLLAGLNEASI